MPGGTHEYMQDPRNENVLIYINGEILARSEAKVSVFDSGFLLGDGVWEGIRLHNGQLVFCEEHIDRLYSGAAAIGMDIGMPRIPKSIRSVNLIVSKPALKRTI